MSVQTEYDMTTADGDASIAHNNDYRAISLRGPLILTGWGFDINNDPVPYQKEEDGNDDKKENRKRFLNDWLRKPHTWKTGPVDLRWDESRGVWTAPSPMKLVQVTLCGCLDEDGSVRAKLEDETPQEHLGKGLKKESESAEGINDDCGDETPCDELVEKEGEDGAEEDKRVQTVMVSNATGKLISIGTKVMAYFDTVKGKYFVISAPEPLFYAELKSGTKSDGATSTKVMNHFNSGVAEITSAFDGSGIKDCNGDPATVEIINTLKQPICVGQKLFVRLTECGEVGEDGTTETTYKGEVLQAEFDPMTVVTSVDCFEDAHGTPTLEICDRVIYLQTAWSIEDCGNDDREERKDTKGWNPTTDDDGGASIDPADKDEWWECG